MRNLLSAAVLATASISSAGSVPAGEVTLTRIIHSIEPGMVPGDVMAVIGDDFTRVVSMMVDAEVWRYDFPSEQGYTFTAHSGEDEVDTAGLGSGRMRMQVFVVWNEQGLLGEYTVYTGSDSGVIREFRVFPDGSVRKSVLQEPGTR